MAATAAAADAPPTISSLSREALGRQDGLVDQAVNEVANMLRKDVKLLRSVVEAAVRDAVTYRASHAMRSDRAAIIHRATNEKANVLALARGLSASLLDMPLAGGIRLRDCERSFVQREADRFDGLARDCGHKARFLAHVAQSVPEGKTVGQVIDDGRALDLWKDAA